ncbi:MAG: crotonase/enoyl-CoA hydratase family protein [Methylovirgula sp.]
MLTESVHAITRPKDVEISSAEVIDEIRHEAGPLAQIKLDYEPQIKTLWVTIAPEPKPVFTLGLVDSVSRLQRAIVSLWGKEDYGQSPIRFFAYRAKGPIFTFGGDLDFYLDCIGRGDRGALQEHARLSIEGVLGNATSLSGTAITMATIEGKGIGGGIDAPLSCNMVIAEEQTSFSYPEVKFNHFPVASVAVLSRRVGTRAAHKLLSTGTEFTAAEFEALGALDAVAAAGQGEAWLRKFASETMPMHAARLGLYEAFHRRRAEEFRSELIALAAAWTDHMLKLSPMEISRLQRISVGQDRMLQHIYGMAKQERLVKAPAGNRAAPAVTQNA